MGKCVSYDQTKRKNELMEKIIREDYFHYSYSQYAKQALINRNAYLEELRVLEQNMQ